MASILGSPWTFAAVVVLLIVVGCALEWMRKP